MDNGGTSSTNQQMIDQRNEVSLDIKEIANSLRERLKIKKALSGTLHL
jgi:hypothetical protein